MESRKIITMCGPHKFENTMFEYKRKYEDNGYLVFMPDSFNVTDISKLEKYQIDNLHLIHELKMLYSEKVVFVNEYGYLGKDTIRELKFCINNGISYSFVYKKNDGTEYTSDDYINKVESKDPDDEITKRISNLESKVDCLQDLVVKYLNIVR